jgi:hypothetical protein
MRWIYAVAFVGAVSLVGCNPPAPKSEEEIKTAFTALQAAIKAKDVDKIWSLLAQDTQGDTEREGKAVKEAFGKLADKDKPEYEKKVGLSANELTEMTGKLYVKSSTFFTGETGEMPGSKFDKVVLTGEIAKVHYIEDDGKGDREIRNVFREDGLWKFVLPVPKAVLK